MYDFFLLIAALFLVLLNAFFVAAEFSMVKLRHTRVQMIKNQYGFRGKILEQVHLHLDAYLSACQLGITLASLGLGWLGKPAFAHLVEPIFRLIGIHSAEMLDLASFLSAFSIISFLHIVVGELMPKSLAIRQAEIVSIWTAAPLYGFYWLMYPAIWLLNHCSNFLLKIVGLDASHNSDNVYSTKEIKTILNASHMHGAITENEADIIEQTLDLAELDVTEIIRPVEEMIMLDINESMDENFQIMMKHRYSRYPIYETSKDNIIGIIHIKDLFGSFLKYKQDTDLRKIMRSAIKIPHYLPALDLLHKFRDGMSHFALVYRGKETLLGFVTLDNLLQVMIGHIKDEFHKTQDDWVKNHDGTFSVKGKSSIYAVEKALGFEILVNEDEQDISSLGGLIIARVGKVPKRGTRITFNKFDVIVTEVQGSHIRKMVIRLKPPNEEDA